jgi:hypothetical protein
MTTRPEAVLPARSAVSMTRRAGILKGTKNDPRARRVNRQRSRAGGAADAGQWRRVTKRKARVIALLRPQEFSLDAGGDELAPEAAVGTKHVGGPLRSAVETEIGQRHMMRRSLGLDRPWLRRAETLMSWTGEKTVLQP